MTTTTSEKLDSAAASGVGSTPLAVGIDHSSIER